MGKKLINKSYMAAVYLRLSKEDEDLSLRTGKTESNSIANQKALILKELDSMPEATLYDIYIDDGYTGLNFERPEFKRMCNDIYDGRVNMVIVKDLSRLGRDYIDSGRYVQKIFPSLDVRFVSVLDHFDSLTASQTDIHLLVPVKNFVNDSYSRDISSKIRSHQEIMRENGLYVGPYVAYGYRKKPDDKNKIEPDAYAADIVRKIFAWRLEGMSADRIAGKLNSLGILSPSEYKRQQGISYKSGFQKKSRAEWSAVAVLRILKNRIYIGVMEQGKTEKVNYKLKKIVNKPQEEWDVVVGRHEPIISEEDFENVSRLLRVDTRNAPDREVPYLFSGVLFCSDCGKAMTRRVKKQKVNTYVYYICSTRNKRKGCSIHSIEEYVVRDIVLDALQRHIGQLAELDSLVQEMRAMEIKSRDIIANDQEILMKYEEANQCRKMEVSLHKDFLDGIISKEEYAQFSKVYAERAASAEEAAGKLRKEMETVFQRGLLRNEWMKQFARERNIKELDRNIILQMVDKIIVYEGKKIEIIFRYEDEYKAACRITGVVSDIAAGEKLISCNHAGARKAASDMAGGEA